VNAKAIEAGSLNIQEDLAALVQDITVTASNETERQEFIVALGVRVLWLLTHKHEAAVKANATREMSKLLEDVRSGEPKHQRAASLQGEAPIG
jgi:hypothetical protein